MAKIILHPKIVESKRNLKMLSILVDQYVKSDKAKVLLKLKEEQCQVKKEV